MKTLRTFSLILFLMALCPMWASVINVSQAQQLAGRFLSSRSMPAAKLRLVHQAPSFRASAASPYYVFNVDRADGGYVIIAGDDRVPPVLGYSDNGSFDMRAVPEAMQKWLDGYAQQILALDDGGNAATHIGATAPIEPMVKAEWSQRAPYNTMLPVLSSGSNAAVGCVATAMAQLMHYWHWPKRTLRIIPSYVSDTLHINMPALPTVDFNWDAMQNTYLTDDINSAAAKAAAQLSLYCAQSLKMNFMENMSSASTADVIPAMYTYFNYTSTAKYLQRRFFTTQQWEQMVLDELAARRPIIYRGRKVSGGHAFICDGYDGNGMFHFNWGWNGSGNGYFLLSVLNPDQQGTGSAAGSYGYIIDQAMITGLEPGSAGEAGLDVAAKQIEVSSVKNTRTSTSADFSVTQETHFLNIMSNTIDFNYGWALYKGNELIKVLDWKLRTGLASWYYCSPSSTLNFGSGITSGTYRIVPIYSKPYTTAWKPCIGADINYIEVVINGNRCTVTGHGDALQPYYQVNSINVTGNMHNGRPVNVALDVTNLGNTRNDMLYMFAGKELVCGGFIDLERNARGLVAFEYLPANAGTVTLKFAYDEKGTNVFATKSIVIGQMPYAKLSGTARPLNVTDATNRLMTAKEFAVDLTATNAGSSTYDEDITIKLYKRTNGNYGTLVQAHDEHVVIPSGRSVKLTFHLDNVMDGWQYFAKIYYYSSGEQVSLGGISFHTIVFPTDTKPGDVNGDGEVTVADVNAVIDMILARKYSAVGDINGDGEITVADVNAVIDIILDNH